MSKATKEMERFFNSGYNCQRSEMIKKRQKLEEFERKLQAMENLPYEKALKIYDALYKEAVALGAISHENIWDGFEAVLRISRVINGLPAENFKN